MDSISLMDSIGVRERQIYSNATIKGFTAVLRYLNHLYIPQAQYLCNENNASYYLFTCLEKNNPP